MEVYCASENSDDCKLCTEHIQKDHYPEGVFIGTDTYKDKYCWSLCANTKDRCKRLTWGMSVYCKQHASLHEKKDSEYIACLTRKLNSTQTPRCETQKHGQTPKLSQEELVDLFPSFVDIDVSPLKPISTQKSRMSNGSKVTPKEYFRQLSVWSGSVVFLDDLKKRHPDIISDVDTLSVDTASYINPVILYSSWYMDVLLNCLNTIRDLELDVTQVLTIVRSNITDNIINREVIYAVFGNFKMMGIQIFKNVCNDLDMLQRLQMVAECQQETFVRTLLRDS